MCGLYGIINKFKTGYFNSMEVGHFFDMGWITSLRGRDSSSIWGISREHPERYPREWKAMGDSSYLQYTKVGPSIVKFLTKEAVAAFGHGRKATVGKVSIDNQHPFRHKHIVLMHNGTISGGLEGKEKEVEVDSHALAIQIAEKGVEETLKKVEGPFAIIAYDLNKQKILIARNFQRDLHYIETSDLIFIMTDKGALEYIVKDRMGRKNEFAKSFLPMQIYEIDPTNAHLDTVTKFEKKYPPVTSDFKYNGHTMFEGWVPNEAGILSKVQTEAVNFSKRKVDDAEWKIKRGQQCTFIVEDFKKAEKGGTWKYWGTDLAGNNIVFFSGQRTDKWLDRIGRAPIVGAIPEKPDEAHKELTYIVSPREIKWLPAWNDLTEQERSEVLENHLCDICNNPFDENDINTLIIEELTPLKVKHGECEVAISENEKQTAEISNLPV